MKPVAIFRHSPTEGPGYLATHLDRSRIPWSLLAVDEGVPVPESPESYSGLVFMGGPMSVNDPLPWVTQELELIRQAAAEGIPVLGHCLGGQLIAKALGAEVGRNPVKEIGWHEIVRVESAGDAGITEQLPACFEGYHWHGETFTLPGGATLLMRSAHCRHQAFIKDRALALQFHVEVTGAMVKEWCAEYRAELAHCAGQPAVQSAAQMTERLEERIAGLQRVADSLYDYWLDLKTQ